MAAITGGTILVSRLSATPNQWMVGGTLATFAGAATQFAFPGNLQQIVASFAGAATQFADSPQFAIRLRSAAQRGEPNSNDLHLRTLLAEFVDTAIPTFATFAEAGSLTGVLTPPAGGATAWAGVATFAGAESLIATPNQFLISTAKFAGIATQFAVAPDRATATFAGVSALLSTPIQRMLVSANLTGTSGFFAAYQDTAGASYIADRAGNLVTLRDGTQITIRTFAATQWAAIAAFAGTAFEVASGQVFKPAIAVFTASAALSETPIQRMLVSAPLSGVGALFAAPTIAGQVNAWAGVATFAGFGASSFNATSQTFAAFATLPGTGFVSATPIQRMLVSSVFAGTETLFADTDQVWTSTATFAAAAAEFTSPVVLKPAIAAFASAGALSETPIQRMLVSAQLAAASAFLATAVFPGSATITMGGAATIFANTSVLRRAVAMFAGLSTVTANAQRLTFSVAQLSGSGVLSVHAERYAVAVVTFAGFSTFVPVPRQIIVAIASFTGTSAILSSLTNASESHVAFPGNSVIRIVATLVRNPSVIILSGNVGGARVLHGNVVSDEGLHGEVGKTRMLRAG